MKTAILDKNITRPAAAVRASHIATSANSAANTAARTTSGADVTPPFTPELDDAPIRESSLRTSSGLLTACHELRLAKRAERGDQKAREVLVNSNLRLVTSIAKKYQNRGIPLEDLIQEGTLGLIHAVDKYDWRRGFRFSTYATHWIRQALGRPSRTRGVRFACRRTRSKVWDASSARAKCWRPN
jgi:RNA polymerase primary sigma factor